MKVAVYWRDISATGDSWKSLEEAVSWAKGVFSKEMQTLGELIYQDNDLIVVAGSIDNETPDYNDLSMIMKSVVIRIVPLEEKLDSAFTF